MEDWKYTFDPVTITQWIEQIESDLKGASLSSIQSTWWDGEVLAPLVHQDITANENVRLPDHLFLTPPILTERIDIDQDPEIVNRQVLDALSGGVGQVVFPCDPHDFKTSWLDDVMRDLIKIQLEPAPEYTGSNQSTGSFLPSGVQIRIDRNPDGPGLSFLVDQHARELLQMQWLYRVPHQGPWVDPLAEIFNLLIRDIKESAQYDYNATDFLQHVILRMEPSGDYLLQVIQTRAIQLMMLNIARELNAGSVKASSVEIFIRQQEAETNDAFLIRAAICSLAASMTGVGAICVHSHTATPESGMYRRVSRNIHHLLHEESLMCKGKDPLEGAYVPDHYTRKWCGEIWAKIKW